MFSKAGKAVDKTLTRHPVRLHLVKGQVVAKIGLQISKSFSHSAVLVHHKTTITLSVSKSPTFSNGFICIRRTSFLGWNAEHLWQQAVLWV